MIRVTATFIVVGAEDAVLAWQNEAVDETARIARKYRVALLGGETTIVPTTEPAP